MDGSKFWCFPWFSENSLLCVIQCMILDRLILWLNLQLCSSTISEQQFSILALLLSCGTDELYLDGPLPTKYNSGTIWIQFTTRTLALWQLSSNVKILYCLTEFVDRLSWFYYNAKLYFFVDKEGKLIIRMSKTFSNMRQSIS